VKKANQNRGGPTKVRVPVLHLLFPGDAPSVRRALKTAVAVFRDMTGNDALVGVVELVLAEALNNIVEHAYGEHARGLVDLEAEYLAPALVFRIRDEGQPMPEGDAPQGSPHDLDVSTQDLPEGGFGWFLIRELTEDLSYRRCGNRNELTFRIAPSAEAADG